MRGFLFRRRPSGHAGIPRQGQRNGLGIKAAEGRGVEALEVAVETDAFVEARANVVGLQGGVRRLVR